MTSEQKLEVLIQLGENIAKERDLHLLLRSLADSASRLVGAERCSVFVYDEHSKTLWSQVAQGLDNVLCINLGQGIVGKCAATKQTSVVNDAYNDPDFFKGVDNATGYKTYSLLTVPMLGADYQVIGVLQLLNKKEGAFEPDDTQVITMLARYAGILLENALMHDSLTKQFAHKSDTLIKRNKELELANSKIGAMLKDQDRLIRTAIDGVHTPLAMISAQFASLSDQVKEARWFKVIAAAAKSLGVIYDDFCYLQSRAKLPPKTALPLSDVVNERISYFEDIAHTRNQTLRFQIEPDIAGNYRKSDIERIVDNTISSALKYSPDGSVIDISLTQKAAYAFLAITDCGAKVSERERDYAESFGNEENSSRFGLGLSIVREICADDHIQIVTKPNIPSGTIVEYHFAVNAKG